ncbi:MAG: hypothetical protein ACJA2G_003383 [Cognaticolwellia sp.]|jgi:hypothetical protein
MPTNKHKRKTAAHAKPKAAKYALSSRLITLHPKAFVFVGLFFVVLGLYLLTFEAKNNAMFGVAMLSLIAGTVTTIYANFAMPKKKQTK